MTQTDVYLQVMTNAVKKKTPALKEFSLKVITLEAKSQRSAFPEAGAYGPRLGREESGGLPGPERPGPD